MINLNYILLTFVTISVFKVNYSKSSMAGIGVDEGALCRFVGILGCKMENWPMKYLGFPLGGCSKSIFFLVSSNGV